MHTVWTSDDVDYARSGTWSKYNNNTVFDVYADPKEISVLETPPVPENQMVYWQGLPYKLENGTVTYADNARVVNEGLPRNKAPKYKILGQLPNKYTLPSSFRLSTFIPITTTLNHIADNE